MIQSIVDGISLTLHTAFGDGYKIYTESVKQGFQKPCFFIQLVTLQSRLQRGRRFFRQSSFCIHYFPNSKNAPKAECFQMQDDLFLALEYITVDDDLLRGINMSGEFEQGVLHFLISYNMVVGMEQETTSMEWIDAQQTTVQ